MLLCSARSDSPFSSRMNELYSSSGQRNSSSGSCSPLTPLLFYTALMRLVTADRWALLSSGCAPCGGCSRRTALYQPPENSQGEVALSGFGDKPLRVTVLLWDCSLQTAGSVLVLPWPRESSLAGQDPAPALHSRVWDAACSQKGGAHFLPVCP